MLQVKEIDIRLLNLRLRFPFRYGQVTVGALPHLFLTLTFEVDGECVRGTAADNLSPKWFTKDPNTTIEQDAADMISLVRHAADHAVLAGKKADVYSLVSHVYQAQGIESPWGHRVILTDATTNEIALIFRAIFAFSPIRFWVLS